MSEFCIHELPLEQCGHCKLPPHGINKIVYVTAGGTSFHNRPSCSTLKTGQDEAEAMGKDIHPIRPIGWAVAANDRRACRNCCIAYYEKKA